MFNATTPLSPPDFVWLPVRDADAAVDPDASHSDVAAACCMAIPPALAAWDADSPHALGAAVMQLVQQHAKAQRQRLDACPDVVRRQVASLRDMDGVDVSVTASADGQLVVAVTMPLCEKGTLHGVVDSGGDAPAHMRCITAGRRLTLDVTFMPGPSATVHAAIDGPHAAFPLSRAVKPVPWPPGATLASYHAMALQTVEVPWRARRDVCVQLRKCVGCALEHDSVDFSYMSFLLTVKRPTRCVVCVKVSLPAAFPDACPTLTLLSAVPSPSGELLTHSVTEYPFSPRWPAPEMAQRLLKAVLGQLPAFLKATAGSTGAGAGAAAT